MIYIYNCFGGTHSSVLAAAYHLKKLDGTREPSNEEIMSLPLFNKLRYRDRGKLYFHGIDEEGNKVYTIGRGRSQVLIPGIKHVIEMLHKEKVLQEKIILSNCLPTVPTTMKFGGLFSRWLKIDPVGIPLLLLGTKQTYRNIVHLVEHTKYMAKTSPDQLVFLCNDEFRF